MLIAVAIALMLLAAPFAAVPPAQAASLLDEGAEFASPILGRKIRASVYLPSAYRDGRAQPKRYPVVYLLHGLGDSHKAWPRLGRIKPTLDRLIETGTLQPAIVVMPGAGSSWYVNDARTDGNGRVFDAFLTDLIAAVDARYRTVACRHGRAIGGLSMGGYGALLLGFAQPNRFAAVFSLSGAVFSEELSRDPKQKKFLARLYRGVHGDPLNPDRLADWNIFNRLNAVKQHQSSPSVWLSTGDDDYFQSIVSGSVRAFLLLRRAGVPAELRVDDAKHDWKYWRRAVVPALTWASPQLAKACP